MIDNEKHIDNLVRHISLVREACILLGKHFIRNGQEEFGRILIAHGHQHDFSKFHGIEWDNLHTGIKIPQDRLKMAISQHVRTNPHHPEHWGGIAKMPEIFLAEMVCDWYARAQEGATDLRAWITNEALAKFNIPIDGEIHKKINGYVDIIAPSPFQAMEK